MPLPLAIALSWPLMMQAAPTSRLLVDAPDAVPTPQRPASAAAPVAQAPGPVDAEPATEGTEGAEKGEGPAPIDAEPETEAPPAKLDRKADAKVQKFKFKPGRGFELATKDGNYVLAIRARLQMRYDLEHPNTPGEEIDHVLQIRRARVVFAGNVFGKHNRYYIQLGFSPRDMLGGLPDDSPGIRYNPVRDARVEFTYLRDATVWLGQMKVPFSRQRVISSGNQQFVDRSSVNEEFNLDRDIGLVLRSDDIGGIGRLKYALGVFMGDGRNAYALTNTGALYVGRVTVMPLGKFEDDSEADLDRIKKPGLSLGGAYAYHDDAPGERGVHGPRPADGGTTDIHHATADLMFKWRGLSIESAFHYRKARRRNPGGAVDEMGLPVPVALARDGVGWFGQVGYLIPPADVEFVTRYSFVRNIFGDRSSMIDRDELGGGVNYYIAEHNFKISFDYFRVWDGLLGPTVREAMANGIDRFRLQVQLAF
ncbi:Phosphate-selective porin O and P [Nannocystis exedens]|uniref:Phosphate-selective porin O and P n=1 Tax=Nannocystis exedens TaxID=54 RepID=A0A1I1TPP8_9BACT|nr:porin [Nannocystis exedens]PCC66495.1 Phosphate-selective porin O and P [Nannocystis exedens]SFD59178.1 Phosphate-selective porin O and P [Nannocystis exedens]